jgi:hypothetical protein
MGYAHPQLTQAVFYFMAEKVHIINCREKIIN